MKGYTGKGLIFGRYINLEGDNEINPEAEGFLLIMKEKEDRLKA